MNGPSIWVVAPVHEGWFRELSELVHTLYVLMVSSTSAKEIRYGPISLRRDLPGCPCMPCVRVRKWYDEFHHRLMHGPYG